MSQIHLLLTIHMATPSISPLDRAPHAAPGFQACPLVCPSPNAQRSSQNTNPRSQKSFNATHCSQDEVQIPPNFSSLNFCPHTPYHFALAMPAFFRFLENARLSGTPKPLYRLFLLSRTLSHPTSFHSHPPSDCSVNPHFLPSAPTFLCVLTGHKLPYHALPIAL